MSTHIPQVVFRDTLILWVMLRSPRTLGTVFRQLREKSKRISLREFIGRIDFLASRGLVQLTFPHNIKHPMVNITDKVPDGFLSILAKVKVAHNLIDSRT